MTSGDDGASEPAYRKDRRRFAAREETRRLRPFLSGSDAAIPSRRTALTLMAALPLAASPVAALAQTETAPPAPDTLRLFRNLLTRMGVAVALNGGPARTFIIDTGAERSAVSRELAQTLGLPSGPDVMVHGVTAAEATPTVRVEAVEVGRRRFPGLEMPVFPRQALGADGLLGLDLLSRFRLVLDVQAGRALLARPGEGVSVGEAGEIGARRQADVVVSGRRGPSGQLILTRVVVDGVKTSAFIDSGAQYSIGNLALMRAARIAPATDPHRPTRMEGIVGGAVAVQSGDARDLKIAGRALGPTPLLFADLHAFHILNLMDEPALLLGGDVLTRFSHVILDYGRGRVAFGGLLRRS